MSYPYGSTLNPVPIQIGPIAILPSLDTPARHFDLRVQRGDSLSLVFRAFREVIGGDVDCGCSSSSSPEYGTSPQVLTGLQARATIRRAKDHPVEYPLTVVVDVTGAGSPTRGFITVSASAEVTRLLPDHGVWDLELNDGTDALRKTLVEGRLLFGRDISL